MATYGFLSATNLAATTAYSDNFIQLQEPTGKVVYKNADYMAISDKKNIVQLSPTTQVSSNLSSAQIDFKIENIIDQIEYPTLQWTLTNNTGSNASAVSAPFFIQRIDTMAQNGSTLIHSVYDQELFMQYFYLDRNTYEAEASTIGLTNTYDDAGTVVANGASIVFNLPLYGFWKAVKIAPYALATPLLVRIYFNPSSLIVLTGTMMTCVSLNMIIRGKMLKSGPKDALLKIYKNPKVPLSLAHLSIDRQTITVNLQASQTVKLIVTGVTGIVSFLIFTVRLASDTTSAANQHNYIQMPSFDFLDSSGASLIGFYQRDIYTQQIDYANNFGNNAWLDQTFHIISWSSNPRQSFVTGSNFGYCIATGNEYLTFTTGSGLASNSYQVDIRAYCHENIIYEDNKLKSTRV